MRNLDIRMCPWSIEKLNGQETRVYSHKGYKCGLISVRKNFPHACVYVWGLQYPDGQYKEMDLAEANKVIFENED